MLLLQKNSEKEQKNQQLQKLNLKNLVQWRIIQM
jgi:hypothetical protein